ncbi:MAG: Gfo/Idh/MocA family protein [Allosphingosinicella sp.]
MTIRIAIIGYGKIAQDQHVPAILADARYALAAVATRGGDPGLGVPWHASPAEMFDAMRGRLDAVAVCTPPIVRHAIAGAALRAGLDVLLEKPPAATLGEIEDLERLAGRCGCTLYTGWHSQHAAGVARAAEALAGASIAALDIEWYEDVRKWHPGQEWIWQPGGFGVFDPGINALSISTRILPVPLFVREAALVVPANRQAPIAADLTFVGKEMRARMDWRFTEGERWTIYVETSEGSTVELRDGGARLLVGGVEQVLAGHGEYSSIYDRFAGLVAERASEVDREPLRIVADAFLVGRREPTEPFL